MTNRCIDDVIDALQSKKEGDSDLESYLMSVCSNEEALKDKLSTGPGGLLESFIDAMKKSPQDMLQPLKSNLGLSEGGKEVDKALRSVSEKFFQALESRCDDREHFKSLFDKPDLFERGIGTIIFLLIFLYGWVGEETSTAFGSISEAMQTSQGSRPEAIVTGSIEILWVMIVMLIKYWILMVALVASLYFVEMFIVEAALAPDGDAVRPNKMKSIRVAMFFLLDRRVAYAIFISVILSMIFFFCCILYLAISNATPEDAKVVGKMACAFQLLIVFSFVVFIAMR